MRFVMLTALLGLSVQGWSQPFFNRFDSVPVTENATLLKWAWAGGLNHPQFNNIDLNNDGVQDLLLLDKSGDKQLTFLRNGSGVDGWELAPKYRAMFTSLDNSGHERPHDWLLTRDFNCDGRMDFFTYSSGGVAVYRNDSQSGQDTLIFTLMTDLILSDYGSGPINIYVSPVDLPAIEDMDGDGDLDIVTFSLQGFFAEYHRNRSQELYGHCDSLVFNLEESCWGSFAEDASNVFVSLNQTCKGGTAAIEHQTESSAARHSGFSLLAIDIDADQDQDMVLSNVAYKKLNLLTNGGDLNSALITTQDAQFPINNGAINEVDLDVFPAPYAVDINNDGRSDLVASPNQENNGRNYDGAWLYTDQATTGAKNYQFVRNNFLQHGMIELGTSAYPALVDVSGDGLLDLIVGNNGYFISTGTYSRQLAYYRNVGTASAPAFMLVTRDYATVSDMDLTNAAPTFGDLDADGDLDMLIGDGTGDLHYFRNNASATTEAQFVLTQPGFQGINVGQMATPQLVDIDGDLLLDLVIGRNNGTVYYYHNTGTAANPIFTQDDTNFGGIIVRAPGVSYGYSSPYFFRDNGDLKAFVGAENGVLHHYTGITNTMALPDQISGDVGTGNVASTNADDTPFGFSKRSGRHQFLIKASELSAAGLGAGLITKLGITVLNANIFQLAQLNIGVVNTTANDLSGFTGGITNCYSQQADTIVLGYNEFVCQNPMAWDGVSNLIVQFCYYHVQNNGAMPDFQVECTSTPFNSNAYATATTTSGCNIAYVGSSALRPNLSFTMKPTFPYGGRLPMYEGERLTCTGGDLNGDGFLDLILGNLAGGLSYYKGAASGIGPNGVEQVVATPQTGFVLFPNPTADQFTIRAERQDLRGFELEVIDLTGRIIASQNVAGPQATFGTETLRSGTYIVRVSVGNRATHHRLVVQH